MMEKKFSLILPTHYHPRLVRRLFDSIFFNTTNLDQIEIVLYLDRDDVQSHRLSHPMLSVVRVIGAPDTMGRMIRTAYKSARGKYIMLLNDDMIFRTNNWDGLVHDAFARNPDDIAMVYGNDLYYGHLMCTFPIIPRTICEILPEIFPQEYKSYCIDAHIFDTFKRLALLGHQRMIYLKDVIFEHMFYELIATGDCCVSSENNHPNDQTCYFTLAEKRQIFAKQMAEYIENKKKERQGIKGSLYAEKV